MLLFRIMMFVILTITTAFSEALPGCPSMCGNVNVPYPFGVREGCYLNPHFLITCNSTNSSTTPLLRKGNIEVTDISLEGELRVYTQVLSVHADKTFDWTSGSNRLSDRSFLSLLAFTLSATRNKFTAIGCNILVTVSMIDEVNIFSGCRTVCNNDSSSMSEGSCDGHRCCQIAIPKNFSNYYSTVQRNNDSLETRLCGHVFIGEERSVNFSTNCLNKIENEEQVHTVIDWAVWNETCHVARTNLTSYACKAANSECYQPPDINGYRCNCSKGYQGNPYLSEGCKDVDECKNPDDNDCDKICENIIGSYTCSCPRWFHGDGRRGGERCIDNQFLIKTTVGVSVGMIGLLFIIGFMYLLIKKRNLIRLKEKYFKQNGGLLLQQQLGDGYASSRSGIRIFTAEELKKATYNYSETRILGQGGYGTVYKGVLPNNTIVAIKKSKEVNQMQAEQFVNEVIILSQINHRNVVRLLGCCFETAVPLLVYEFVGNGTLFEHIHNEDVHSKMSWETRLRITANIAGVLSYLHSAASVPIIHRDIKSTNILLDESYVAKVSDFGTSRLIPLDQAEMSTLVQGTLGYLDPEYLRTSTLTEKSDVYSFGVVLVELLTGKKALSFEKPEEERSLAMHFLYSMKEERLFQIVEDSVVRSDLDAWQLKEVAVLAKKCLRMKGVERPTMKEVALELQGIRVMANHPWVAVELNPEETQNLLGETSDSVVYSEISLMNDSMRSQVMPPVASGR